MKPEFLLETYLKQLRLPCFAQSYQTLAEASRANQLELRTLPVRAGEGAR
jgi:hypothetical protein